MTARSAIRAFLATAAFLLLVGCTTATRGVGTDGTPIVPTPTTAGIITPLLGSPPTPTAIPSFPPTSAPTVIPSPSSPTPVPGGLSFARTITNADNGGTVQIRMGDRIALALQAPVGSDLWDVALPDAQVLTSVPHPGAAAIRGATLRAFQAVRPGQTAITATDRIHCDAGQVCPGAIQSFRVTVVVTS